MASFGWWNGSTGETTLTASLLFPQPPAHTTFQMLLLDLKQKWERKPSENISVSTFFCRGLLVPIPTILSIYLYLESYVGASTPKVGEWAERCDSRIKGRKIHLKKNHKNGEGICYRTKESLIMA